MQTATCTGCLKDKHLTEFEVYRGARRKRCRVCVAARRRDAYARNPQPIRDRENAKYDEVKRKRKHQAARAEGRLAILVQGARHRAKKRGYPFDLDDYGAQSRLTEDMNRGTCRLTGLPFDLSTVRAWNSPSLDRIKPEEGYTQDNTRIVLLAVNAALGNWGEGVFAHIARAYLEDQRCPS